MRNNLLITATLMVLTSGLAQAASTDEEVFANAALRELHNLAAASAQSERAAKDSDDVGCRDAYEGMQKAAHEALTNMHYMSFAPIDAIDDVSSLLRLTHLVPNGCAWDLVTDTHVLLMKAGQAIMALRWDYAIGDGDWYMVNPSGDVEAKNPLRYAQSLKDQNYSWVDVRPKGMMAIIESDWKAEVGSHEVGDPSIENSGNNLKATEVDYRKDSRDSNTIVFFYRTKDDALAAAQTAKQQAENDAKAAAEQTAFVAEWRQELTSLPYMIANHDVGFKLTYGECKPSGKNAKGENTCDFDSSQDWSDSRAVPYRWFSNIDECEDAATQFKAKPPGDSDDMATDCVPASRVSGHTPKGYEMAVALFVQGTDADQTMYADLRENASQAAHVFRTFNECYGAMTAAYSRIEKDLGVDEDGTLVSDKMKSIGITWTCVRVY